MKKFLYLLASAVLAIVFLNGCEDRSEIDTGVEPILDGKSGNADLTRFVSIGNSLTAGYQSGALYESAQIYSFPNLIAKQVNTQFVMPLYTDPGSGGRMEVQAITATGAVIVNNPNTGVPKNLTYPAPYNNLGVPGALAYDVLFATNSSTSATGANPFFDLVLRNSVLNLGTQLQQALAQNPTFVSLWVGNNEILGYATSGGTSPSAPFPLTTFTNLYGGISQQLAASGAKVVVANIPNVNSIPFLTTVGPLIAINPSIPWSTLPLGFVFQRAGETAIGSGSASSQDLLTGKHLITLRGSTYAGLLGQPTGKFYRDFNYPQLPAGVDTTKPFGFHPQNPWPNPLILDSLEISVAQIAVTSYNSVIQSVATTFGFALADVNTLFNTIRQADFSGGYVIDGLTLRTDYIRGGLFSLDGVHPTAQGHAIVANEFIKAINTKFNAKIPRINVATMPASLPLAGKIVWIDGYPQVDPTVFDNLLF